MESQGGSASVLIGMLVTLREELARVQSENRRLRELLESTATGRMLIARQNSPSPRVSEGGAAPPQHFRGARVMLRSWEKDDLEISIDGWRCARRGGLCDARGRAVFGDAGNSLAVTDRCRRRRTDHHSQRGPAASQFRVYPGDFNQGEGGENAFFEIGTQEGSCGDRLRVTPDVAVLGTGETQELRVEVEPGEKPCWSVVFVQGSPVGANGITISQRIAVKVYGAARAASALAGEVMSVEAVPVAGTVGVTFEFRNDSASPVRPTGRVELRTLEGAAVAQLAIDPFSVLPGNVRKLTVEVPAELGPGRYVAVPILDFGGEYLAGGQGIFRVE